MACTSPLLVTHPRLRSLSFSAARKKFTDMYGEDGFRFLQTYKNKTIPDKILVPCGKCYNCRRRRASDWRVRLLAESEAAQNTVFVTLTIAPEHYNNGKPDIQKMLREMWFRYRYVFRNKLTGEYARIPKHWFIIEAGEERGRLHLHGFIWDSHIFTPPAPCDLLHPRISKGKKVYYNHLSTELIRKIWRFGFADVAYSFSPKLVSYATKYMLKQFTKSNGIIIKAPVLCSPGVGRVLADHCLDYIRDCIRANQPCLIQSGRYKVPLPRYYTGFAFDPEESLRLADVRAQSVLAMCGSYRISVNGLTFNSEEEYLKYCQRFNIDLHARETAIPSRVESKTYPRKTRHAHIDRGKLQLYYDRFVETALTFDPDEFESINTLNNIPIWHSFET